MGQAPGISKPGLGIRSFECSARIHCSLSAKDPKERPSSSSSGSSGGQPTPGSGNKIFPKLQKVSTSSSPGITRQDTIDEMVEVEQMHSRNLTLRKMQSYDCGLRDPTIASMYQTAVPEAIAPLEYKELMTNLMDFKVCYKCLVCYYSFVICYYSSFSTAFIFFGVLSS